MLDWSYLLSGLNLGRMIANSNTHTYCASKGIARILRLRSVFYYVMFVVIELILYFNILWHGIRCQIVDLYSYVTLFFKLSFTPIKDVRYFYIIAFWRKKCYWHCIFQFVFAPILCSMLC